MIVGEGMYRYRVVEGWGQLPEGWNFTETEVVLPPELAYAGDFTGVYALAVDSEDRVHVSNHGVHPVIIFDRDGNFQASWGKAYSVFLRMGFLWGLTVRSIASIWSTITYKSSPVKVNYFSRGETKINRRILVT